MFSCTVSGFTSGFSHSLITKIINIVLTLVKKTHISVYLETIIEHACNTVENLAHIRILVQVLNTWAKKKLVHTLYSEEKKNCLINATPVFAHARKT